MSIGRRVAIAAAGILLPLAAVRGEDFRETARSNIEAHTGWDDDEPGKRGSPFRKVLKEKVTLRGQGGQKTPKAIVYEAPALYADDDGLDDATGEPLGWGKGDCEDRKRCPKGGYVVKYKAVTRLEYDGPGDVHDRKGGEKPVWPRLQVEKLERNPATHEWEPVRDPDGNPVVVDKTQEYRDFVAAQAAAMGRVAWKVDPQDPEDPGEYEFGQEPQEEDVSEEITFTFGEEDQAQGEAFFRQLSAAMAAGDVSAERAILMGFTYRGPNIDYTIGSSRRVCIFGCFYLWDIRAGFALDFALGLRTPAFSRLYGPPEMVAGNGYVFSSVIETAPQGDWTPGDWAPAAYAAAGVDPFAERGDPRGEGNEFVMYFELFAGAKVKILGINVCPWCKYVEIDEDYSASFATPFGGGTFPIPSLEFVVKEFNFGIVALAVGLYVTPQVGSTDISAMTGGGAPIHHAAPGVPATFGVTACIEDEAPAPRWQTVSLEEYRYNFDQFKIVLGAFLDFSVLGYGVWHPRFDFLTLNLSSALGTLGLYLPDHRNCNWAFQCAPAPANQVVSVTSQLFDLSPPSTGLVLDGSAGKNGWWVSDVAATLVPADNPAGCGAGIASSWWGLSDPPAAQGTSFLLASEAIQTAHWRSVDRDGNAEGVNQRVVKIDKTPPTITGAPTTEANPRGWYRRDVTVRFEAADATSGVATKTADTTLTAEAADQEVLGTAEDHAGLTRTFTVRGIHIDKTPPVVAIAVPSATGTYENTDVIQLEWSVTDALSGPFTKGGTFDGAEAASGQVVELVYLGGGHHVVRAFGTDRADNENAAEVTFLVDVDIDGLLAAVDAVCERAWVTKTGICGSLRTKVLAAKASLALELKEDARGQLGAFLHELDAQQDKSVLDPAYRLLRTDAEYVLVRYGLVPST